MAFPHPKPRKDNDRDEDKPKNGDVLDNFLSRIINETEDRKAKDDVNRAKNRSFGALVHNVVMCDFVPNKASGRVPCPTPTTPK
jgi:hypothetical protein